MTLEECYTALGGDYQDVLGRLRSEKLVSKFLLKFLDDGSFDLLVTSMDKSDWSEAFRAAHTIKGVCQNLSFTRLFTSASQLCEALRPGGPPQSPDLFTQVKTDYEATLSAIRTYQAGLPA